MSDPGGGLVGKRIAVALGCAAVLLTASLVAVAVWPSSNRSIALSRLAPGVSAHVDHDRSLFLVRSDRQVRAFLADARYRPGDELWWCPEERVFVGSPGGGMFDESGRKISGPARSGLVSFDVRVSNGRVAVDLDRRKVSPETDRAPAPSGIRTDRPWDAGPGSFCEGAVKPLNTIWTTDATSFDGESR